MSLEIVLSSKLWIAGLALVSAATCPFQSWGATTCLFFVVNESVEIISQRNLVSLFEMICHRRIVVTNFLSTQLTSQQGFLTAWITDEDNVVFAGHQMGRGQVLWELLRIAEVRSVFAKAASVTTSPANPSLKVICILFDWSQFFFDFWSWIDFLCSVDDSRLMIFQWTILSRWWSN